MPYQIEFSPETEAHLRLLTARQRTIVFDAIDDQLLHQPNIPTRNRKPLRPNHLAPWEPRIGGIRVYYDIVDQERRIVVLAIGIKDGNRVRIGGKEIEL